MNAFPSNPEREQEFASRRKEMVRRQLRGRDVSSPRVLEAMDRVPRHMFVPAGLLGEAYDDHPLAIGHGQTISQPYIVGLMTQILDPKPGSRILEIGAGSGYQTAVMAELAGHVYAMEIIEPLAREAEARLRTQGYRNVTLRVGDGRGGWPEEAPFDGILAAAAAESVPPRLIEQLKIGARLVLPVGTADQRLETITRTQDGFISETILGVRFVPMTGDTTNNPARP